MVDESALYDRSFNPTMMGVSITTGELRRLKLLDDGTIGGGGGPSGAINHATLTNLDYAHAGHTGFAPTVHTHTKANITDFVETDYVHTAGNESVAGIKAFASSPTVPDPTLPTDVVNLETLNTTVAAATASINNLSGVLAGGNSAGSNQIDMNNNRILNTGYPVAPKDTASKLYVDTVVSSVSGAETLAEILVKGNTAGATQIDMTNQKVVNVATCTVSGDAANKGYVDQQVGLETLQTVSVRGSTSDQTIVLTNPGTGLIVDGTAVINALNIGTSTIYLRPTYLDMNGYPIYNVLTPVSSGDATNKGYVDTVAAILSAALMGNNELYEILRNGNTAGPYQIDMNFNNIINVAVPVLSGDAANKTYVDTLADALSANFNNYYTKTEVDTISAELQNWTEIRYNQALAYTDQASANLVDWTELRYAQSINYTDVASANLTAFIESQKLSDILEHGNNAGIYSIDMNGNAISNLLTPAISGDATNKYYVDSWVDILSAGLLAQNELREILANGNSAGSYQIDMNGNNIVNVATPIVSADAVNKYYVDTWVDLLTAGLIAQNELSEILANGNTAGPYQINMNGNNIVNVGFPSASGDATNKLYVDIVSGDLLDKILAQNELAEILANNNSAGAYQINMNGNRIINVDSPVVSGDAVNLGYLQTTVDALSASVTSQLNLATVLLGGNSAGPSQIDMNGNNIVNVATPNTSGDAANKLYVDTWVDILTAGLIAQNELSEILANGNTAGPYQINMNNNNIINVGSPVVSGDATNKDYVDNITYSLSAAIVATDLQTVYNNSDGNKRITLSNIASGLRLKSPDTTYAYSNYMLAVEDSNAYGVVGGIQWHEGFVEFDTYAKVDAGQRTIYGPGYQDTTSSDYIVSIDDDTKRYVIQEANGPLDAHVFKGTGIDTRNYLTLAETLSGTDHSYIRAKDTADANYGVIRYNVIDNQWEIYDYTTSSYQPIMFLTSIAAITGSINLKAVLGNGNVAGGYQIDMQNQKVINVATPTVSSDAVNKTYVDNQISLETLQAVSTRGNTYDGTITLTNAGTGLVVEGTLVAKTFESQKIITITEIVSGNELIGGALVVNGDSTLGDSPTDIIDLNGTASYYGNISTPANVVNKGYVDTLVAETSGNLNTLSKILSGGNSAGANQIDMNNNRIINLSNPILTTDASNKFYVDAVSGQLLQQLQAQDELYEILAKGNSAGSYQINMNNNRIINLATPVASGDSTTKDYVDTWVGVLSAELLAQNELSEILANGNSAGSYQINMNGNKIVNLATPTTSADSSNKYYVDTQILMLSGAMLDNEYARKPINETITGSWTFTNTLNISGDTVVSFGTPASGKINQTPIGLWIRNTDSNNTGFYIGADNKYLFRTDVQNNEVGWAFQEPSGIDIIRLYSMAGDIGQLDVLYRQSGNEYFARITHDGTDAVIDTNQGQIDVTNHRIINASNPIDDQDVVTKNYLDGLLGTGGKFGDLQPADFSGSPLTADITFTTVAIASAYNVVVNSEDARIWTFHNKTASGFMLNSNSATSLVYPVEWQIIYKRVYA